jgi:hypothetical protein
VKLKLKLMFAEHCEVADFDRLYVCYLPICLLTPCHCHNLPHHILTHPLTTL